MENYKKMMEEGWISQTVIQEKLAQRRRTAKTRYHEDCAALERVYQEKINQAKEELRKKINTLVDMRREDRARLAEKRDQVLAEIAAEEDEMKRCLSEMAKAEQPNEQTD